MIELLFYGLLATLTLTFPLYHYKHPSWVVIAGSMGEFVCICLIYASTFLSCSDSEACGGNWNTIIPALFATMNLGMIWPILAAYAKQAQKDQERSREEQQK